jgi:Protein of unknown function (DUF3106)
MSWLCQIGHRWTVLCLAVMVAGVSLAARADTNTVLAPSTNHAAGIVPPFPQLHSPVDFFRNLLAMSPAERENYLTNKTPEVHERLLAKVNEYLALDPNERELRLRATELRWYLLPLFHQAPTNRASRLATVPAGLKDLVNSRLAQWDALPAPFRQEFLDNERTLRYFTHLDTGNNPVQGDGHHQPDGDDQARWNALSENERQKITNQFNEFFALTPDEKQKTLNTLSDAERQQMEKTLQTFSTLPPAQRVQCLRAFTEFASMNAKDRAEFLKNAEHWSQMSPKERQAWRDLVASVPQWPPLPAGIMPPLPPKIQPRGRGLVATNVD